jgi:hypothetical protein
VIRIAVLGCDAKRGASIQNRPRRPRKVAKFINHIVRYNPTIMAPVRAGQIYDFFEADMSAHYRHVVGDVLRTMISRPLWTHVWSTCRKA